MGYFGIYSVIDGQSANDSIQRGGTGVLVDGRRWTTAARLLASKDDGEVLPLLLADAASIRGVAWVGAIKRIELPETGGSRVHFEALLALRERIPLSSLLKASDREPLDETYRRPYVPCLLTEQAAALASGVVRQLRAARAEPTDPRTRDVERELDTDPQTRDLSDTVRRALVDARLGQGAYRRALLRLWRGRCALTGCAIPEVLVASHVKPWSESSAQERLDPYNGLLLAASVDRLFDRGLISFRDDGRVLINDGLTDADLAAVALRRTARLVQVLPRHRPYLAAHRVAHGFDVATTTQSSRRC